jgi:hypothetical protein
MWQGDKYTAAKLGKQEKISDNRGKTAWWGKAGKIRPSGPNLVCRKERKKKVEEKGNDDNKDSSSSPQFGYKARIFWVVAAKLKIKLHFWFKEK